MFSALAICSILGLSHRRLYIVYPSRTLPSSSPPPPPSPPLPLSQTQRSEKAVMASRQKHPRGLLYLRKCERGETRKFRSTLTGPHPLPLPSFYILYVMYYFSLFLFRAVSLALPPTSFFLDFISHAPVRYNYRKAPALGRTFRIFELRFFLFPILQYSSTLFFQDAAILFLCTERNIAIIAMQYSKMYFVDTFGDFSHSVQ